MRLDVLALGGPQPHRPGSPQTSRSITRTHAPGGRPFILSKIA